MSRYNVKSDEAKEQPHVGGVLPRAARPESPPFSRKQKEEIQQQVSHHFLHTSSNNNNTNKNTPGVLVVDNNAGAARERDEGFGLDWIRVRPLVG